MKYKVTDNDGERHVIQADSVYVDESLVVFVDKDGEGYDTVASFYAPTLVAREDVIQEDKK